MEYVAILRKLFLRHAGLGEDKFIYAFASFEDAQVMATRLNDAHKYFSELEKTK